MPVDQGKGLDLPRGHHVLHGRRRLRGALSAAPLPIAFGGTEDRVDDEPVTGMQRDVAHGRAREAGAGEGHVVRPRRKKGGVEDPRGPVASSRVNPVGT